MLSRRRTSASKICPLLSLVCAAPTAVLSGLKTVNPTWLTRFPGAMGDEQEPERRNSTLALTAFHASIACCVQSRRLASVIPAGNGPGATHMVTTAVCQRTRTRSGVSSGLITGV
jgi:hypothetical protein